jgi:hypothetical protein
VRLVKTNLYRFRDTVYPRHPNFFPQWQLVSGNIKSKRIVYKFFEITSIKFTWKYIVIDAGNFDRLCWDLANYGHQSDDPQKEILLKMAVFNS